MTDTGRSRSKFREKSVEPEMIYIPPGPFTMGSDPRADENAQPSEQPQHQVYLPSFHMAKSPITNAQYALFVAATNRAPPQHWSVAGPPTGKEHHPVVFVSWYDAIAYCRWFGTNTGKHFRLPSEAEWEKAARGLDGRRFPWGDTWDPNLCNANESGIGDTSRVDAYPQGKSPYGLLDMAGNVYEWTKSLWGKDIKEPAFGYPYDPVDGREDSYAANGVLRVLRGGAFFYDSVYARAAHRVKSYPDYRVRTRGFRVCMQG